MAVSLSPAQRSIRASLAAHELHAQGKTNTMAAREARWQKYLVTVDPDGVLEEAERIRRAEHARQADMKRMSLAAAKARSAKARVTTKGGTDVAA